MLLSGAKDRVGLIKQCTLPDGRTTPNLLVEMTCVFKHGKPHAFVSLLRPSAP